MNNLHLVDIVLAIPVREFFTYSVPAHMVENCLPGMRVVIPFGKRKKMTGIVVRVAQNVNQSYELKEIEEVLDSKPIVSSIALKFWHWLANYYVCFPGEVMSAALPAGLKLESETRISLKRDFELDETLSGKEREVFELLFTEKQLTVKELEKRLGMTYAMPVLKRLEDKKVIYANEQVKAGYKAKTERIISLSDEYDTEEKYSLLLDNLKSAPKQQGLVLLFLELAGAGGRTYSNNVRRQLLVDKGASISALKALINKKILRESSQEISRIELKDVRQTELKELAPFQLTAYSEITSLFKSKPVVFLHGITSSGKTELYAHLANKTINNGQQVLYLVPEIALTAQLTLRLKQYFGNSLVVYHSRMSDNERVEIWKKVSSSDEISIVLGPRSAQFLPFASLGLVIVDEEHEASYKQEQPAPRYHGRDSAIMLGIMHGAKVLLGSATPSLETYANSQSGKYGYVRLDHRYGNMPMPSMTMVDMAAAYKKRKFVGHLSYDLLTAMRETLNDQQQVILFLNRRGYAPLVECKSCGWVLKCPMCDVSLTKHKFKDEMRCHYCGHISQIPKSCGACANPVMIDKGLGTEQLEEEVKTLLPGYKIGRMDLDTTKSKNGFEKIITAFENRQIDVLIGTQMVSKGLDFDHVGLVGIIKADAMLNLSDFRASERAYQMIEQVAGRSGRKGKQGRVFIQTFQPNHPVIAKAVAQSQQAFYISELEERRLFHYPPYTHIVVVTLKHVFMDNVKEAADVMATGLRSQIQGFVLGPEPPAISRIKNQYLQQIFVKILKSQSQDVAKKVILNLMDSVKKMDKKFASVTINVDVDPV